MPRTLVTLLTLLLSVALAPLASAKGHDAERIHFGVISDVLYNEEEVDDTQRLVDAMNARDLDFSLHLGDLTYGPAQPHFCSDATLLYHRDNVLNALRHPVLYTPGDNEWSDCPLLGAFGVPVGSKYPLERLASIRANFFSTQSSLGARVTRVSRQQGWPENQRIVRGGVVIASIHTVGGSDSLESLAVAPELGPDQKERFAANVRWLRHTFAFARKINAPGVLVFSHANPDQDTRTFWELPAISHGPGLPPEPIVRPDAWPQAFPPLLAELRRLTLAFDKPVAYVHGDSHYFRVDQPLVLDPADPTQRPVPNFTRAEGYGSPNINWVEGIIDPHDEDVFSFKKHVIRENITG